MENASRICILILNGMKDCFCGILAIRHFLYSESDANRAAHRLTSKSQQTSISDLLRQCFVFGFIFVSVNFAFSYCIINFMLTKVASVMDVEMTAVSFLPNILYTIFTTFWVIPVCFVSRILNYIWYQDIADLAMKRTGVRKNVSPSISAFIADQAQNFILQGFFLIQGFIVYYIPIIPFPIYVLHFWYLVHTSLLSSLYAFEYKWIQIGWSVQKRLNYINSKLPYFLGFGLPLAAATSFIPSIIDSMTVFSALFPLYVISSTVTRDSQSEKYNCRINIFKPASYCTTLCVRLFTKLPFF